MSILHTFKKYIYGILIPINKYFYERKLVKLLKKGEAKLAVDSVWDYMFHKSFPWDNPQTLNEKITWLSACSDTSQWTDLADKILVRDFVKKKGCKEILTKIYGIWDDASKIDFEKLPIKCVLKCNHDCGSTIILDKTKKFDKQHIVDFLNKHLHHKIGLESCEPHYYKIQPMIMAEEFICNSNEIDSTSPVDYKFWCFDGHVESCMIISNRTNDSYLLDLYNLSPWLPIRDCLSDSFQTQNFKDIPEPKNLNKMIEYAKVLSKGFPQVRIDLYNMDGIIYFGEMTFTSQGGRMSYYSPLYQKKLGNLVNLQL